MDGVNRHLAGSLSLLPSSWLRQRQSGYSLYDLIITSAVASILGVSAVGMSSLVQDARMTAAANQLMGHLSLARSEAIKRNTMLALCKSKNGVSCSGESSWHEGWIVFTDDNNNHEVDAGETVIHVQQALEGNMTLRYGETGKYSYVRYNPSGEVWPGATFTFCDRRGADNAKAVVVYWTGRPRVSTKTSEGKLLNCS
jgi:type IV fimbrial biogenesis protein FimT